jgi:hypothetical protein
MPKTIQFHLDEYVADAIAKGLRRQGIDVTTTLDARLRGASDQDHLAFGLAHGRVVVTNDDDYIQLHSQGITHHSIAFCAQGSRSIGQIIAGLLLIWEIMEPEDMRNHIEFL